MIAEELRGPNDDSPESVREIDRVLTRRALSNFSADPLRTLEGRARNLAHYFWPPLVPYYVEGPQTRIVIASSGEVAVVWAVARSRVEIVAYYAPVTLDRWYDVLLTRRHLRTSVATPTPA